MCAQLWPSSPVPFPSILIDSLPSPRPRAGFACGLDWMVDLGNPSAARGVAETGKGEERSLDGQGGAPSESSPGAGFCSGCLENPSGSICRRPFGGADNALFGVLVVDAGSHMPALIIIIIIIITITPSLAR
ncbi:uncharacterized protein LY79DRAFT_576912 [Colletotrichum navitas]|uniref:Uncharacterized protein n=1 Tax=Colletotrichum navitas TaxID=681940 RepID=A0AAD8Q7E9_9PEZI|nr:uncharacterized protein LY79DRAFT_576912 [Colletotrichum navitas]KAK1597187.1 hypothetical protein LY79DRAFT_576912 [Colletotrichum navitas]